MGRLDLQERTNGGPEGIGGDQLIGLDPAVRRGRHEARAVPQLIVVELVENQEWAST